METPNAKPRTAPKDMPSQLTDSQRWVAQQQKPRDELPPQQPVTDDAPPPAPPAKWKRALKTVGAALLLLVALAFAYVFLLLGEPEDVPETDAPAAHADAIRVPMTAVDAPPDADLNGVAASFGVPMLVLYTDQAALQGVRLYDTAYEGMYARRAALRYAFPDGTLLQADSYRPADSVSLLMDERYALRIDRLYSLAGMNAVRMDGGQFVCVLAQSDEAAYVIRCPRTHMDALETLLRQTALVRPSAEF